MILINYSQNFTSQTHILALTTLMYLKNINKTSQEYHTQAQNTKASMHQISLSHKHNLNTYLSIFQPQKSTKILFK